MLYSTKSGFAKKQNRIKFTAFAGKHYPLAGNKFIACFFGPKINPSSSPDAIIIFSSKSDIKLIIIAANNKIDTATTVSIIIVLFFAEEQEGAKVSASLDEVLVLKNLNTFISVSSR